MSSAANRLRLSIKPESVESSWSIHLTDDCSPLLILPVSFIKSQDISFSFFCFSQMPNSLRVSSRACLSPSVSLIIAFENFHSFSASLFFVRWLRRFFFGLDTVVGYPETTLPPRLVTCWPTKWRSAATSRRWAVTRSRLLSSIPEQSSNLWSNTTRLDREHQIKRP